MSLNPKTFEEALQRAQKRPQKPRKPLRSRSTLKLAQKPISRKRAPVKKKVKRLSVGKLKKKVWDALSIFVRLKAANELGEVQCVTCGKWMRSWEFTTRGGEVLTLPGWKAAQAGHFVPGRTSSVLLDERNIHVQCGNCNVYLHGNLIEYWPFMERTYGREVIDELLRLKNVTRKWRPDELQALYEHYRELNNQHPLIRKGE